MFFLRKKLKHQNIVDTTISFSLFVIGEWIHSIGMGSRGAAAPLEIFWLPGRLTLSPRDLYPEPFLGQKNAPNPAKTFFIFIFGERLFLEQKKRFKSGEDLFSWRKLVFGTEKCSKSGALLFFFFWRTLIFGTRKRSNSSEDLFYAFPILALSALPLLSKNSSRATDPQCWRQII